VRGIGILGSSLAGTEKAQILQKSWLWGCASAR
jgi:hypothetical protein